MFSKNFCFSARKVTKAIQIKAGNAHFSRLAEIFRDERHLTGGEKLGVLAEGALLQGFVERTAALYPAVETVYCHVWLGEKGTGGGRGIALCDEVKKGKSLPQGRLPFSSF